MGKVVKFYRVYDEGVASLTPEKEYDCFNEDGIWVYIRDDNKKPLAIRKKGSSFGEFELIDKDKTTQTGVYGGEKW